MWKKWKPSPRRKTRKVVFTRNCQKNCPLRSINMEGVAVSYRWPAHLKKLSLRIDQDDRIAPLLGETVKENQLFPSCWQANFNHPKARWCNLPSCGSAISPSIRWMSCTSTRRYSTSCACALEQPRLRARLAGFGLMADQAETVVGRLSGGQKAACRCSSPPSTLRIC